MKKIIYLIIVIVISVQSFSYIRAQNTVGEEFWLTFGSNAHNLSTTTLEFQIRIVAGEVPAIVTLDFTNLNCDSSVTFPVKANEIYTYILDDVQRQAVYNNPLGITCKTNYSVRITSTAPVSAYAMNHISASADATNILPVSTFGTEYFQISYTPPHSAQFDAYAVIATQNNTRLHHNELLETILNKGEVYNKTINPDMTGAYITADNPVVFFAVNPRVYVPGGGLVSCLMQQLAPINMWGKKFFVPVSHLTRDRVRIVASNDGTNISHSGGTLVSSLGSQMNLNNLQAGQFVEIEILSNEDGCYIQSNNPVGVCTFLTNHGSVPNEYSNPAQCWVPAIEQSIPNALIAPFIPDGYTQLKGHYALVCTPTATKENTKVSIGGTPPDDLSGGSWKIHSTAGMSFYSMPLTNDTASYYFTNPAGLIILCHGEGTDSYYYPAGFAMRDLTTAAFYVNNVCDSLLYDTTFCNKSVHFRAEIEEVFSNWTSIKWFVDYGSGYVEEVSATNQINWGKDFENGTFPSKMVVEFENGETATRTGILKVQALWIKMRNIRY
jgi:hypothetical protein